MSHDVLRRMVSPPPPAPEDVPITSSRAMRLAVTRAADKTYQMVVNVIGVREETLSLDDMLGALDPDLMLLAMLDAEHMVGIAAVDLNLRAALIEMQTVGKVLSLEPDGRPPTLTDATMAEPLLGAVLHHMAETTLRTPLEGWGKGVTIAGRVPSARNAGLILPDRAYRVIRMSIDLNAGNRQGELVFAMPDNRAKEPVHAVAAPDTGWGARFEVTVNASPVRLHAQLHQFSMPIYGVEQLRVGQILPLNGCKVTSIKLLAKDGRAVATARLGQSGGMRAIRVEAATLPQMEDLQQFGGQIASGFAAADSNFGITQDVADMMSIDTINMNASDADSTMSDVVKSNEGVEIGGLDTDKSNDDAFVSELSGENGSTDPEDSVQMEPMSTLDWSDEEL